MSRQITHSTISLNGIDIFFREAGNKNHPALLLLHGFPSSSAMFKNLMVALSDKYYLIAPDYPGFGFSSFPDKKNYEYSFKNISKTINDLTKAIGLTSFSLYLHDYGCPIGLRLCIDHPEKIDRLIIQNGNAYNEGMGPEWNETKDYWENPTEEKKKKVSAFLSERGTRNQYTAGIPEKLLQNISPELWMLDWQRMQRPGNIDMQFELNCDYQNNIKMFPRFQQYFREHQPTALIIWGKYDVFFSVNEAICYKRDLANVEIHVLEGGHKALETNFDEVLDLVDRFLARHPI